MSREFALALDLGTTGVRALVVAADGAVRSRAYRPLTTQYPAAGCVEQDPLEMWERSLVVLREALRAAGLGARDVAALGVASQRATALAWEDGSGRPLAPAIGWQDARGAEIAAQYRARGVPLASLSSVTKFLWWLRRDPAVRAAASAGVLRLGNPDAWLTERLTAGAAHVTDPGHASCTALYDLRRGDWSHAALELFELEERFLPRVVATSGIVDETDAKLLGAPVAVAAHAGDQQAACFAQGVHAAGDAKLTLGTSAMLDLHTGAAPCKPVPGAFPLALWRLSDARDAFCLEGNVITAGAAVDWLAAVGLLARSEDLDRAAARVATSEGVAFVPALQGLGTPFGDEAARGLIGGLTRGTTSAHVARAAVEGIAHRCTDVCDALAAPAADLHVDGGLARSELLLQTLADVSGRRVLCAAETETTALGAAFLAGLATGMFESPSACRAALRPPRIFEPLTSADRRQRDRERWRSIVARSFGKPAAGGRAVSRRRT